MVNRISDARAFEEILASIATLYQKCFSEPPWNEVFDASEVMEWLRKIVGHTGSIALVKSGEQKIMGATFCFPVHQKKDIAGYIPQNIKIEDVIYLAEIFVDPLFREQGIGSALHAERLRLAKSDGFRFAIERTHFQSKMFPLMKKTGFHVIGEQDVVSTKLIGGEKRTIADRRAVFFREL